MQGYLFGRPMAMPDFWNHLALHRSEPLSQALSA
jgi:hypothetical protein